MENMNNIETKPKSITQDIFVVETEDDDIAAKNSGINSILLEKNSSGHYDGSWLKSQFSEGKKVYLVTGKRNLDWVAETGQQLSTQGVNVLVTFLRQEKNDPDVTLAHYLNTHNVESFANIVKNSHNFVSLCIKDLPHDLFSAQVDLNKKIFPLMLGYDYAMQQHFINEIVGLLKCGQKTIKPMFSEFIKQQKKSSQKPVEYDPELLGTAKELLLDSRLLKKRIDAVNKMGVVGERRAISLYYAGLDSRLLTSGRQNGQSTLAIKNTGHYGSGKSYTLQGALSIYPEDAYVMINSGSAKALYYLDTPLKHKCLVVAEAFQLSGHRGDSDISYIIRTLLSEGKAIHRTNQKNEDGVFAPVELTVEGPTSLITTSILPTLEKQLEDRLFSVHPDESPGQTKRIIERKADIESGKISTLSEHEIQLWKAAHSLLEPVNVVIPFAQNISTFINQKSLPIALRRAFGKVLNVIKTVTCAYQFQRERDEEGRVIATIEDYYMAMQIFEESFKENVGGMSSIASERLEYISKKGPISVKDLSHHYGVTRSAVSGWIRKFDQDQLVTWVDSSGKSFKDSKTLNSAKSSGAAFVVALQSVANVLNISLPKPHELCADEGWRPGEKNWNLYDLNLNGSGPIVSSSAPELTGNTVFGNLKSEQAEPQTFISTDIIPGLGLTKEQVDALPFPEDDDEDGDEDQNFDYECDVTMEDLI